MSSCACAAKSVNVPHLPITFGIGCHPHYSGLPPICDGLKHRTFVGWVSPAIGWQGNASWCDLPFCTVENASACEAAGKKVHPYDFNKDLHYSYEVCQALDLTKNVRDADNACACRSVSGRSATLLPSLAVDTMTKWTWNNRLMSRHESEHLLKMQRHSFCMSAVAETPMFYFDNGYDAETYQLYPYEFDQVQLAAPFFPTATMPACFVSEACTLKKRALPLRINGSQAAWLSYEACGSPDVPYTLPHSCPTLTHYGTASKNWRCVSNGIAIVKETFHETMTINACFYACDLRAACKGVRYTRTTSICELIEEVRGETHVPCASCESMSDPMYVKAVHRSQYPHFQKQQLSSAWSGLIRSIRSFSSDTLPGDVTRAATVDPDTNRAVLTQRELYAILQAILNWDRTDPWQTRNKLLDETTIQVMIISANLDTHNQQHVRKFVPTASYVRVPRLRRCAQLDEETDGVSNIKTDTSCPSPHTALWTTDDALDPRLVHGEATLGTDSISHWFAVHCKESSDRPIVISNGTHVFLNAAHMWVEGDLTVGVKGAQFNRNELSFDYCTHPFIPGKMHCGYLESAVRWLLVLVDPTSENLCSALREGLPCDVPNPTFVVGSDSNGASIMIIFLMLLRGHMLHTRGVDIAEENMIIRMWYAQPVGDDAFVHSYEKIFGSKTRYIGNMASYYWHMSFANQLKMVDVPSTSFNSLGSCGAYGDKTTYDCVRKCSADNWQDVTECLLLPIFFLAEDPDGNHVTGVASAIGFDETAHSKEIYQPYQDNFYQRQISGLIHLLDHVINDVIAPKDNAEVNVRAALSDVMMTSVCQAEIEASPWDANAVSAMSSWLAGYFQTWCELEGDRLKLRVSSGDEDPDILLTWNRICSLTSHQK